MSQVIVLDTHIWIWFILQEFERFPSHWRDVIETADTVAISPVSCYEVALAQQKGRLQLPMLYRTLASRCFGAIWHNIVSNNSANCL